MLKEIKDIGKSYRESREKGFIFSLLIRPEEQEKESEEGRCLLGFNFNLENNNIELFIREIDEKIMEEYLWIGNCKGNIPQDRLTTDSVKYLFFDSLINLYNNLEKSELKDVLDKVKKNFLISQNIGDKEVIFLDIRKIKDFNKINSIDLEINKIKEEMEKESDIKKKIKKFKDSYERLFYTLLKKTKDLTKNDISVYSATFNNKKPSEFSEYIDYLENKIIDESFEESFEGECFVCGKKDLLTYDTARIPAKFYITKLITFSSELEGKRKEKGFSKNFSLCKECYKDLVSGITYIKNCLNAYLADNTLWIIPGLFFNPIDQTLTEGWMDFSKRCVLSTFSLDNFLKFKETIEKKLQDYMLYEDLIDYSYVDLLFYKQPPGREEFKIRKLIREIPLKRIKQIRDGIKEIKNLGDNLLGERDDWFLILDSIYYLIPVRKGEIQEYKKILDIYENVFLGYKLDKDILIDSFVTLSKIYRFEKPDYNVKPGQSPEINLVISILKTNLLLKLFEKLNLLKGGDSYMVSLQGILDEEIEKYVNRMGWSEEETALFLLGYLVGEIGAKQIEGADFNAKKPILNKINFNGISPRNLINLSNEIFEKLDQYRIRGYNEKIYSVMKSLLDVHIKDWKLSDSENVYYILSGYAFNTYKRITNSKRKEKE